jgi:hypothetical protein
MIPSIVRQSWFTDVPTLYLRETEADPFAYFSWETKYRNRPVQLLFGLCPTEPPTEIADTLWSFHFEVINGLALWSSQDERAILRYDPERGDLGYTYHPSLKSFENHLAMLRHFAENWN